MKKMQVRVAMFMAMLALVILAFCLGMVMEKREIEQAELAAVETSAPADVNGEVEQAESVAAKMDSWSNDPEPAPSVNGLAEQSEPVAAPNNDSLIDHFVPTSYDYTMYGVFVQVKEMDEGCLVGAFKPLAEGGVDYEGYPWGMLYIPTSVLQEANIKASDLDVWPNEERAVCITVVNDDRSGAFISLPSMVVDIETIAREDIPMWGGR